jgi:peptidoglycan/xylan/chitin deacetylase (PgdA/CDA1 family)
MTAVRNRLRAIATWLTGYDRPKSPVILAAPAVPENEVKLVSYADKARAQGFNRLMLYLTFDCDTDEDAKAALDLDPWLRARGIRAAYAVPGVQLERAAESYRKLKTAGATFLNHGACAHAEWRDDHYVPITFYDKWSTDQVINDIRRGHAIVSAVLGEAPAGFRAPHFGSYQRSEQLSIIYGVVRELGYLYCSTTIPQMGLDHGPLIDHQGLFEIPLFGSHLAPTTILDSWTYLEDRKTYRLGQQYFDLFRDTLNFMQNNRLPGVLAYYADPAHVIGQKPFLDAMDMIVERGIASVTAEELVAEVRWHPDISIQRKRSN